MIRVKGAQGSAQWVTARCGIPTASRFGQIITPAKLTPSKQAAAYMHELLAEWAFGEPVEMESTPMMDRGSELEDAARKSYEFTRGVTVEEVGLCLSDDGEIGCSPDGLIGANGGLEIKTPGIKNHIKYMLCPDALVTDYRLQVHGSLWVCRRQWWDVMSHNPLLPDVVVRVERDDEIAGKINEALVDFLGCLYDAQQTMREMGVEPDVRPVDARQLTEQPEPAAVAT